MANTNQIYIGAIPPSTPSYYFENDDIIEANLVMNVALVGQDLSIDTFTPVVQDKISNLVDIYHFRSSNGQEITTGVGEIFAVDVGDTIGASNLINLANETPIWFYQNQELVGKFYLESVNRRGINEYQINAVSAIGLLENKMHGGGLFQPSGNTPMTFGTVLAHILAKGMHGTGASVISYTIDEDVRDLPVSCWLPRATKRDNLYQLIFAYGVNIIRNSQGNPHFTFIYTAPQNPDAISDDVVYNEGSVDYTKPYEKVTVIEHTYTAVTSVDAVTLFDNTSAQSVSNKEVWFDSAPIIVSTITATGLTLVSANENSAVVSGNGVLTGKPYTHSTRTVMKGNAQAEEKKTISVTDCTAVNVINSDNLLNRLYAFYCQTNFVKKVTGSIVYEKLVNAQGIQTELPKCGRAYSVLNPFKENESAYLASMDITVSAINKASCEWYPGYEPAGQAGLYPIIDPILPDPDEDPDPGEEEEGDWVVPDGVTSFRVVLIGGGQGGSSGEPGYNGDDAITYIEMDQDADLSAIWYGAEGGDGGAGGSGGSGGKIYSVTIENATPGTVCHWKIGVGGEGGAATGFRKDTVAELREALENEQPGVTYTDAQISQLIANYEDANAWSGNVNQGSAGTATTFTIGGITYSSASGTVEAGGYRDPVKGDTYAIGGIGGKKGGKGGARRIEKGTSFNWVTDGEDITGPDGTVYKGGSTGREMTRIPDLSEAKLKVPGGNGAGAAVGLGRNGHSHMDGGSDQSASWEVLEDE